MLDIKKESLTGAGLEAKNGRISILGFLILFISIFSGCTGHYGSISEDTTVFKNFKRGIPVENYKYYFKGHMSYPYANIGLKSEYPFKSPNWQPINLDEIALQTLVFIAFRKTPSYYYGARLLNHKGEDIGIIFTNAWNVRVIMTEDNQIDQVVAFSGQIWEK